MLWHPLPLPAPARLLQAETPSGSHPKAVVMHVSSANPLGKLPRAQSLSVLSPHKGRLCSAALLKDALEMPKGDSPSQVWLYLCWEND